MFFSIVLKYIIISAVVSLIFGTTVLSNMVIHKIWKNKSIGSYLFQFWSFVFFIVVWALYPTKIDIFKAYHLFEWNNTIFIFMAVIPTSIIAYQANKSRPKEPFKVNDFLTGASMEIPQRLLVQNLFVIFGVNTIIYGSITLAILLNALIWVQFIIVQEAINGNKISIRLIPEITASIWFSIWVGILYHVTGTIILPMIVHGLQRAVTYVIRMKFGKLEITEVNETNLSNLSN